MSHQKFRFIDLLNQERLGRLGSLPLDLSDEDFFIFGIVLWGLNVNVSATLLYFRSTFPMKFVIKFLCLKPLILLYFVLF